MILQIFIGFLVMAVTYVLFYFTGLIINFITRSRKGTVFKGAMFWFFLFFILLFSYTIGNALFPAEPNIIYEINKNGIRQ